MMTDVDEATGTSAETAFRGIFGKIGVERARRLLNVLMESPFFYRDDDIDLFGLLKRRASVFRDYFETFYGWELFVDDYVARLIKAKVYNAELRPRQRHVFRLSSRQEYVLFVLLLEFHQLQADEQNLDLDACGEVRFVLADFIEFVFKRYREELGEDAPPEQKILDWARSLFKNLEQYRFITVREKTGIVDEEGLSVAFTKEGAANVLYALLPGVRCYRPEVLTRADLLGGPQPRDDEELDSNNDHESTAAGEEDEELAHVTDDVAPDLEETGS